MGFEPKSLCLRDGYSAVWELGGKGFWAVLLEKGRVGGMGHLVVWLWVAVAERIAMEKEKGWSSGRDVNIRT